MLLFQDDPVPDAAHLYYQIPFPRISFLTKQLSQASSPLYPAYPYPTYPGEKVKRMFSRKAKKNVKDAAEADYYNQWIMSNVG